MNLVSAKFPEDIPWFKASRRAGVAAISAGWWANTFGRRGYLYDAADPAVSGWALDEPKSITWFGIQRPPNETAYVAGGGGQN